MNELELMYKNDTGESVYFELESERMCYPLDDEVLEDFSKNDILHMIKNDQYFWSVEVGNIDENLDNSYDLKIYRTGYVKWLEEKLKEKL